MEHGRAAMLSRIEAALDELHAMGEHGSDHEAEAALAAVEAAGWGPIPEEVTVPPELREALRSIYDRWRHGVEKYGPPWRGDDPDMLVLAAWLRSDGLLRRYRGVE